MSAHHRPQPGDEGILVPDRAQGGEELVEVGGVGMDDAEPTNSIAEAGNVVDHGGAVYRIVNPDATTLTLTLNQTTFARARR